MKVKIIEKTHELDLEDEINDFLEKKNPKILSLHYQVAMTFSSHQRNAHGIVWNEADHTHSRKCVLW